MAKEQTGIETTDTTEAYMAMVDDLIKSRGFKKTRNLRSPAFGDLQNQFEKDDIIILVTRDRGQWSVDREGPGARAGKILPVNMVLDDRTFEILKTEINKTIEG